MLGATTDAYLWLQALLIRIVARPFRGGPYSGVNMESMVAFNPFDPRLRTDPYAVYRAQREESPVHWREAMQIWVLTRYDDIFAVLRDQARFSSDRTKATNPFVQELEAFRQ